MLMSVKLGNSLVKGAGNGLFAGRAFAKGEMITEYPGKIISLEDYDEESDYALMIDGMVIVGPEEYEDPTAAGQFINDVACITELTCNEILRYITTVTLCNTYLVHIEGTGLDKWLVIAIKDIEEGEELYHHYGVGYWTSKIKHDGLDGLDGLDQLDEYLEKDQQAVSEYLTELDMYA